MLSRLNLLRRIPKTPALHQVSVHTRRFSYESQQLPPALGIDDCNPLSPQHERFQNAIDPRHSTFDPKLAKMYEEFEKRINPPTSLLTEARKNALEATFKGR